MELVGRMRSTLEDFAAREKELLAEREERMNAAAVQKEAALEEATKRKSAALKLVRVDHEEHLQHLNQHFSKRQARLENAYASCTKAITAEADDMADKEKYQVQKGMLTASKKREAEKTAADKALRELRGELDKDSKRINETEKNARKVFRRYQDLLALFKAVSPDDVEAPDPEDDEFQLRANLGSLLDELDEHVDTYRRQELPRFFRQISLALLLILTTLAAGGAAFTVFQTKQDPVLYQAIGGGYAFAAILFSVLNHITKKRTRAAIEAAAYALATSRDLVTKAGRKAEARHKASIDRSEAEFKTVETELDEKWKNAQAEATNAREYSQAKLDKKNDRIRRKHEIRHDLAVPGAKTENENHLAAINLEADTERSRINENYDSKIERIEAEYAGGWQSMQDDWHSRWGEILTDAQSANIGIDGLYPEWTADYMANWSAPNEFSMGAAFGRLSVDLKQLTEIQPDPEQLILPENTDLDLPLVLGLPGDGSILLETKDTPGDVVAPTLNNIILRLLSTAPPGRLSFTIIDPVGLGQNFAGIMHLADYEDSLINDRIWTETVQIESRLKDLNEHMEKVIQMYLRNEYETITEYNEKAGNIAEKYHFVVVADFPTGFSEVAAKRLQSIATSGARCGVFTLIHWDRRKRLPQDFVPEDLRQNSVCVTLDEEISIDRRPIPGTSIELFQPPPTDGLIEFIQSIGQSSKDSNRIEVPFEQVAPPDDEIWTLETTKELRVPVGRTGATKFQYLAIGRDTRQHALVAGKTGSGKSTLFHVIITNLALWSSPDEVEFYLIDFKKGVEFKCYAQHRLPHAKVVAIESDREFGLSVLQRVDEELKRRGDLFRKLGVQDVAGYKAAGGDDPMPRSLLLIDEFQEFFTDDDRIAQNASMLLDRIVRQGRAFGIHVILGSQTLGGAYTLPRPTMGQMVVRVALACNEADSYIILDDSNPAARHLSRPGEGIYNDTAGSLEGNSPFQVVWLPDAVRDSYLEKVQEYATAGERRYSRPIVFEGNAPAEIRENEILADLMNSPTVDRTAIPAIYLGAPNSIKGPTKASFEQQSGNNLMIVGQRDEAALAIVSLALISLSAQFSNDELKIILVDGTTPETPERSYLDNVIAAVPPDISRPRAGELDEVFTTLSNDLNQRMDGDPGTIHPRTFVILHGLQRFKKLRYEEDFGFSGDDAESSPNPGTVLNNLITEGPAYGIHVIATIDTLNNVNRAISRKAQTEFERRILFQMSANDSASLIDSPKAGNLGLHRAIFYNEQEGHMETFRPYALPDAEWIEEVKANLAKPA